MIFETDPSKEAKVLAQRGVSLMAAAAIFAGRVVEHEDTRHAYGETRMVATGCVGDTFYTVVYTDRGNVRHLITAWPANRKERKAWHALL